MFFNDAYSLEGFSAYSLFEFNYFIPFVLVHLDVSQFHRITSFFLPMPFCHLVALHLNVTHLLMCHYVEVREVVLVNIHYHPIVRVYAVVIVFLEKTCNEPFAA